RSLQRVLGASADAPCDRAEQVVSRRNDVAARVQQEEATGAVGVLCHPGPEARLSEKGGLLVARDAGDRHAARIQVSVDLRERARAVADLRQDRARDSEQA